MARPLRLEFAHGLYHVTSRGDGREDIYRDNADRALFLEVLSETVDRFNWVIHAYCLMGNHYHLLIETPDGNPIILGYIIQGSVVYWLNCGWQKERPVPCHFCHLTLATLNVCCKA